MTKFVFAAALALSMILSPQLADASVVFGLAGNGSLSGGYRWNGVNTTYATSQGSVERSLAGGLRFSLSGGSYEAYRDRFSWSTVPSVSDFETAINDAFVPWTLVDPVSGFGTSLYFTEDLGTSVSTIVENGVRLGAEIDLFAGNIGTGTRGEAYFNARGISGGVTLTSGTTGYGGLPISGADITMNDNSVTWDLNTFQTILTHEIGHAIGLGDVEDFFGNGFIDNNYDVSDPLGTLTDSWASLVDPLDPSASAGLSIFQVPNDSNGIDAPGVNILMESNIPGFFFSNGAFLQNDDYGGRQFLYPQLLTVPEPSGVLLCCGLVSLAALRRKVAIRLRNRVA